MLSKKNLFALWGGRVANGVGKVGEERPGSWQFVALSSCGNEVFVGEETFKVNEYISLALVSQDPGLFSCLADSTSKSYP